MHSQLLTQLALAGSKKPLSYKTKLGLSILTGNAIDPSLQPQMVARLQSNFHFEPGTNSGTAPPQAKPNFGALGSASKKGISEATPAQRREVGETETA
jgi:hypothetical protein